MPPKLVRSPCMGEQTTFDLYKRWTLDNFPEVPGRKPA